jgi:hypothetical protein
LADEDGVAARAAAVVTVFAVVVVVDRAVVDAVVAAMHPASPTTPATLSAPVMARARAAG